MEELIESQSPNKQTDDPNYSESSFSIGFAGAGSVGGIAYQCSAYSECKIEAELQMSAMTSQNVRDLEAGWTALLDASRQEELREYKQSDTTLSANMSFLGFFAGGGKAQHTTTETRENMVSLGLTEGQIDMAMEMFRDLALTMNSVRLEYTIYNRNNPFSVVGNLLLFVMSGDIETEMGTAQWRSFSDGGLVDNAPAGGETFPLA